MRLAGLVLAVAVSACAAPRAPDRAPALAIPSLCDERCTTSCIPETWPKWTGDPLDPGTWANLGDQVIAELRDIAERCEAHRTACTACLIRLDRAGVTCGIATECVR